MNVNFIILDHLNCVPILGLKTCLNLNLIQRVNKVDVIYSVELNGFIRIKTKNSLKV